ncbi:hypothetical protein [Nitrosomonas sp.]|uniref:hypothetical protein n=1 Tax=Nitrosomonas sp. TaxID=42353 RepID=UPI002617E2EB|nr:hypothetical protein [Nitrosomonas sp.]
MKARLSSSNYLKLARLTSREADDFSLAIMDAWATVADVLTFYQERIVNEGFLRTATERRSVLELGRLVGYQPRPGVASSVYLAYTIDDNFKEETIIPKGARSQSIPGPGDLPQSFEISEDLKARAQWNDLKPRMTQPQTQTTINNPKGPRIYLKGISTNLKPNDPLLIDFGLIDEKNDQLKGPELYQVQAVEPEPAANRTLVILQTAKEIPPITFADPAIVIGKLVEQPTVQVSNRLRLPRMLNEQFGFSNFTFSLPPSSFSGARKMEKEASNNASAVDKIEFSAVTDTAYAVAKIFSPKLQDTLATATANANVTPQSTIKVYALGVKAASFGHNAPLRPIRLNENTKVMEYSEWATENPINHNQPIASFSADSTSGVSPLTVNFSNESSGIIESVVWMIDNVEISRNWNLNQQVFTDVKTYIVTLIATGPGGQSNYELHIEVEPVININ